MCGDCDRGRYFITTSADVALLLWVQKLLPRSIATFLIDRVLPLPPPVSTQQR